jgi:hypothetical protein
MFEFVLWTISEDKIAHLIQFEEREIRPAAWRGENGRWNNQAESGQEAGQAPQREQPKRQGNQEVRGWRISDCAQVAIKLNRIS